MIVCYIMIVLPKFECIPGVTWDHFCSYDGNADLESLCEHFSSTLERQLVCLETANMAVDETSWD